MNFIHLQTSKIQLFDIQIMKNFEVLFWQGNFLFWFWEYKLSTVTHAGAPQLVTSQSGCLKFFLAKLLAREGFWLVELQLDPVIYSVFSADYSVCWENCCWNLRIPVSQLYPGLRNFSNLDFPPHFWCRITYQKLKNGFCQPQLIWISNDRCSCRCY